ncbi:MAG: hypothetical protein LW693_14720 [Saprospiraceae bacterium]|nr:hypothetical protein [Saprospiraceae bacterium]
MKWASLVLASLLVIFLGYFADRTVFPAFTAAWFVLFLLYGWLAFGHHHVPVRLLVLTGIFLRVLLLFSIPNLSDDVFRFLWDGRLTVAARLLYGISTGVSGCFCPGGTCFAR